MKKILLVLCLVASTFAQGTKSSPTPAPTEKIDAAALLKDIVGHAPKTGRELMGILKIRLENGKQRQVPIKWMIRPHEGEWQDVYQTPEQSVVPPETLVVVHRENSPNRYFYKRDGKPIDEVSTNVFIPFGTSDFFVGDFGLEFLHWPNPKHVKTEMRKSRPCYVIETVNPKLQNGPYARVLSWIDTENGGLIRAEAFSANGKLLKEFEIKNVKKVEGRWQLKAVGIRNDQTDTNTLLEFDLELGE